MLLLLMASPVPSIRAERLTFSCYCPPKGLMTMRKMNQQRHACKLVTEVIGGGEMKKLRLPHWVAQGNLRGLLITSVFWTLSSDSSQPQATHPNTQQAWPTTLQEPGTGFVGYLSKV